MLKYDMELDVDYELYEGEDFLTSATKLDDIIKEYIRFFHETPDSDFSLVEVTRKDITDKLAKVN